MFNAICHNEVIFTTCYNRSIKCSFVFDIQLDDRLDSTKDQEITHQMETNRRELESELHEMQTLQQKTAGSNMEFQKQLLDVQHTLQRRNAEVTVGVYRGKS